MIRKMAERSFSMGTPEIAGAAALRETLHAQQELLQQLYNELDVEREASATATSEALSMILRLQGEKAAVEMEASQYKRIAEEKMFHAQETLEIFRGLIYQKEMQIASLEFQVQALRFKLLSLGCNDIVSCETQFPENMLVKRPEIWGERGPHQSQHLKRGSSVPPQWMKDREGSVERDRSGESSPKTLEEIKGQSSLVDKKLENPGTGDFSTYWEQIRKLDERIKELSISKDFAESTVETVNTANNIDGISKPYLLHPQHSPSPPYDPEREELPPKFDGVSDDTDKLPDIETGRVQDIFEVPIASETHIIRMPQKEKRNLINLEIDNPPKADPLMQELFNSGVDRNNIWGRRPPLSPGSDNRRSSDGFGEQQLFPKRPAFGVADLELQQLNRRLKQLEDERITPRREISVEPPAEEEIRLLKEIKKQLSSIHEEIFSWRRKKPPPLEEPALQSLKEAMLHFWT